MSTLADGGRITEEVVDEEIARLQSKWSTREDSHSSAFYVESVMGQGYSQKIDLYEQIQPAGMIEARRECKSMAETGRKLFNVSRTEKKSTNDSHRVKQLLAKYQLTLEQLKRATQPSQSGKSICGHIRT